MHSDCRCESILSRVDPKEELPDQVNCEDQTRIMITDQGHYGRRMAGQHPLCMLALLALF